MQKTILEDIEVYIHISGQRPTYRQLAENRQISIPTVQQHISYLHEKGFLAYFNYCPYCGKKISIK